MNGRPSGRPRCQIESRKIRKQVAARVQGQPLIYLTRTGRMAPADIVVAWVEMRLRQVVYMRQPVPTGQSQPPVTLNACDTHGLSTFTASRIDGSRPGPGQENRPKRRIRVQNRVGSAEVELVVSHTDNAVRMAIRSLRILERP